MVWKTRGKIDLVLICSLPVIIFDKRLVASSFGSSLFVMYTDFFAYVTSKFKQRQC